MAAMNVEVFCDCYRFPAYELPEEPVDGPPYLSCAECGRIAYNLEYIYAKRKK
jgi:hypothetical protein